jgi:intergrase/recombinase
MNLGARGRLGEYYDPERQILEHYEFKDVFIRRSKKVFMSFVPKDVVERVASEKPLKPYDVQNWMKRTGLRPMFSDCRELYASYMTRHLSVPEVDFVQGRVTASVCMRNYFNPTWIADLRERAVRGESEILEMSQLRTVRAD